MISLFRLNVKMMIPRLPLLLLLVALQLILGQIAAVALSDRTPALRIAVFQEESDALSDRYLNALRELPELELVELGSLEEKEKIFTGGTVQGLLVIPEYFDDYLTKGKNRAVQFSPAPGVTDVSLPVEYLLTEILAIRSDLLLDAELEKMNIPRDEIPDEPVYDDPILILEYDGPPVQKQPFLIPPVFGVPALFLLLAFLHAVQTVPGRDNRRILMRGESKLTKAALVSMLALGLIWMVLICLYAAGMFLFYEVRVPVPVFGALAGLALYAIALGGAVAVSGKRHWGTWIFIPWFLLNMTIGGGLWNASMKTPLLTPLVPVSAIVRSSENGSPLGMGLLFALTGVCLILCILLCRTRSALRIK